MDDDKVLYKYGTGATREQIDAIAEGLRRAGGSEAEKKADVLRLEAEQAQIVENIIADLDALLLVDEPEETNTTITPAEISIVKNDYRRSVDHAGMIGRRKLLIAKQASPQKTRIFRTGLEIRRRLESTEAMRCASDSARCNLEATIVYIDLLSHLPSTVTHPTKLEHQYRHPKWRELSDQATACFYQLGAATIEAETDYTLVPFSWNLSQGLWEAARDSNQHDVSIYSIDL